MFIIFKAVVGDAGLTWDGPETTAGTESTAGYAEAKKSKWLH